MTQHFRREVERLKKKILSLCAFVEESVHKSVKSVEERDEKLARSVIETDLEIDQMEVELEEECLKVLALYQPVAIDLRFIVAVLKINNDLERIADEAANIAERSLYLSKKPKVNLPIDLPGMAEKVKAMLDKSLNSLVEMDTDLARLVCKSDDEIDDINRQIFSKVQQRIKSEPDQIEALIHLLSVSRYLERIADHATNIAEDVIYMVEGVITRHSAKS